MVAHAQSASAARLQVAPVMRSLTEEEGEWVEGELPGAAKWQPASQRQAATVKWQPIRQLQSRGEWHAAIGELQSAVERQTAGGQLQHLAGGKAAIELQAARKLEAVVE